MNAMEYKISVITATYNAAKTLPYLIESLRNQTDRDFEWVVIDGASSDKTVELLKQSADVVTKWVSEPDFGIYDALNKGVRLSSGEYYLVIGADDTLTPDAIANYRTAAVETDADIVTTPVMAGGKEMRWINGPSWIYSQRAYIATHAVGSLFRKKLHDKYGYYSRKYPIAADQLFVKRACMGGASLYKARFVAGEFGSEGTSSVDYAGTLTEVFRVQLETERKFMQVVLYILRLIKNYRRL